MAARVRVEGLAHGVGVGRERVGDVHVEAAGPGFLHADLVALEEAGVVEVEGAGLLGGSAHTPLEGGYGRVAAPGGVGVVAETAAGQLAGEVGVVVDVRADGAGVTHEDELVVTVGVARAAHHGLQVGDGGLDLGHEPVDPRLPARRVRGFARALEGEVAGHAVGHDGTELEVVVGTRDEHDHLDLRVARLDGESVALHQLVGVLLAAADADVAGVRARAGDVVRHVGRDPGAVDGGVGRAVTPVVRAVRTGLVGADALPRYLAVAERDESGPAVGEGPLGRVPVELGGLGGADLLELGRKGGGGRGGGRRGRGRRGQADERGGRRRDNGDGASDAGSGAVQDVHDASPVWVLPEVFTGG